jgi:hypothetical protein
VVHLAKIFLHPAERQLLPELAGEAHVRGQPATLANIPSLAWPNVSTIRPALSGDSNVVAGSISRDACDTAIHPSMGAFFVLPFFHLCAPQRSQVCPPRSGTAPRPTFQTIFADILLVIVNKDFLLLVPNGH